MLRLTALIALAALIACTSEVQTNPARTATEEMLTSSAADRAAAKLMLQIPRNALVFMDNGNFEGTDSKYAIASIRTQMLLHGMSFTDDRKKADVIVETRAGALSTDRKSFLIGIPSFNIPIPFSSAPLPFPEIAIYGDDDQKGLAKFAFTAYDAKKGTLVAAQEPQYGFSHNIKKTLLIFITWTHRDYIPTDAQKDDEKSASGNNTPTFGANVNGYSSAPGASAAPAVPAAPVAPAATR